MTLCDQRLSSFYGKRPYEDRRPLARAARTFLESVIAVLERAAPFARPASGKEKFRPGGWPCWREAFAKESVLNRERMLEESV